MCIVRVCTLKDSRREPTLWYSVVTKKNCCFCIHHSRICVYIFVLLLQHQQRQIENFQWFSKIFHKKNTNNSIKSTRLHFNHFDVWINRFSVCIDREVKWCEYCIETKSCTLSVRIKVTHRTKNTKQTLIKLFLVAKG